ncbi:MAG: hypothetical protein GY862_23880 [Gammaproteobacteria bacterium]|nr:hypothetical protein [Gammaproteobacteria bacterium]
MKIAANALYSHAVHNLQEAERPPPPSSFDWQDNNGLRAYLELWCRKNPKPVVLFIDEADSLMDELFLALLAAFQKFYRRYSEAWLEKYDFREAGRQLLMMAFLHRIINAGGNIEREMAVGNGRCDLFAEYGGELFVIELKLYRDRFTREDGLEQTARYLDRLGLEHGYLIIFETRSGISWEERIRREEETVNGKRVTVLGM